MVKQVKNKIDKLIEDVASSLEKLKEIELENVNLLSDSYSLQRITVVKLLLNQAVVSLELIKDSRDGKVE